MRCSYVLPATALFIGLLPSCKTTTASSAKDSDAKASAGLDVNDVAILWPMPATTADIGQMIPLSLPTATGKPVVSEKLFNDIVNHFDYTTNIDGKSVHLRSSADFKGGTINDEGGEIDETAVTGAGPFNRYNDWKIVAIRYDPCAPTAKHNINMKSPQAIRSSFDPINCQPQFRMTAQPIITKDRAAGDIFTPYGNGKAFDGAPRAGDFTIHLLFALTPEQSAAVYADLRSFRDACGDQTSGVPLSIQPCLLSEQLAGKYGGPKAAMLKAMISKYAVNQIGAAGMATRNGGDPWSFMNGLVNNDQFQHLFIDAVHKDTDIHLNSKGVMLEPFSNGYYQMANFKDVPGGGGGSGANATKRIMPPAVPGKVNESFAADINDPTISGTEFRGDVAYTPAQAAAYVKRINTMENPLTNDFFSSDCVSCHIAGALSFDVLNHSNMTAPLRSKLPQGLFGTGVHETPDLKNAGAMFSMVNDPSFLKIAGGNYTNIVDYNNLPRVNHGQPYLFVHFGYMGPSPVISHRVVEEAMVVAKQANAFYGQGQDPAPSCPTEALRACLADLKVNSFFKEYYQMPRTVQLSAHLYPLNYCMQSVCPERLNQLPAVKSAAITTFTTIKDTPLLDGAASLEATPPLYMLPKGTKISGLAVSIPTPEGAHTPLKQVTQVLTMGTVPVRLIETGVTGYATSGLMLGDTISNLFTFDAGQGAVMPAAAQAPADSDAEAAQ